MPGSNLDGTMNPHELAIAIGDLLRALQMPRSLGVLGKPVLPGAEAAFDKVHGELGFGYPTAEEYAIEIEKKFGLR